MVEEGIFDLRIKEGRKFGNVRNEGGEVRESMFSIGSRGFYFFWELSGGCGGRV